MKRYALTGGPGCGKTTVSSFFKKTGYWTILDADAICHELYSDPGSELVHRIKNRWGGQCLAPDGTVDRAALGRVVFNCPEELSALNGIVHPAVGKEIRRRMDAAPGTARCLIDAALYFEAHWDALADFVFCVWTPPRQQTERLLERGWSRENIRARIAGQMPADEKLERSDRGIINSGSMTFLQNQLEEIQSEITNQ